MIDTMTPARLRQLAADVAAQDRALFLCEARECLDLVQRLTDRKPASTDLEVAA